MQGLRNPLATHLSTRALVLILVALIVGSLWLSGRMDHLLYNVGLNKNTCAQNGFGATMCGDQLASYCKNLSNAGIDPGADTENACGDVGVTLLPSLNTSGSP